MIHFELVTLKGLKHRETVYEVLLPTPEGQIAVFKDHAPLVTLTSGGMILVRREANHPEDMLERYAVNAGGVIEIADNNVRVLVDEADASDDIDAAEAQSAYEHAKKLVAEAGDEQSLEQAVANLDRQAVRLKLADLKRRNRR